MTPDIVVVSLRVVSFVADLQAAGIAIFLLVFGGSLAASTGAIRTMGIATAIIGLLFTLTQHLIEPARLVGEFSGVLDWSLHAMLLDTNVAAAVAIRSLGLVLIAAGLFRASRPGYVASIIGATLVAASFALTGHTAAHDLRWALIGFLVVHLIIVSFWFGALLPLVTASRREELDVTGDLIDAFSALATKLVPVIFVAGLVMSVFLLEELNNLWTPYGASLLMKVAGFSALMALAALNKWRFGPGIASGNKASLEAFRRTAVAEWWLITAVIAVAAVMTGLFSPTH